MKKLLAGLVIGSIAAAMTLDAEAQRRLGGGRNLGRQSAPVQQRQATPPATPQQQQTTPPAGQAAPSQQQTPAATAARSGAGATAAARSPMRGALMGLAAGLGIAALASWLGFGEQLAMFLTVLLIGLVLMVILGFVLRRMRGAQPAYGGSGTSRGPGTYAQVGYETTPAPVQRVEPAPLAARPGSAMHEFARPAAGARTAAWGVPAGFDIDRFLANAKNHYAKLQRAWDTGNLDDLSEFTTSDMFIALTHELRARAGHSRTEVVSLDAELLGIESTASEHIASVKFDGALSVDGETEKVSEVWNLSKPVSGTGGWVLAGIQQLA
jgi:predicted lipid-binding transport protein (Tim44 family)